jgi:hypothetical protein
MKKALVVTKPFTGREIGHIERVAEQATIKAWTGFHRQFMEEVLIPSGAEDYPLKAIVLEEGETFDGYWFKDDEKLDVEPTVQAWEETINPGNYVFEDPEDEDNWTETTVTDPSYNHIPSLVGPAIGIEIDWVKHYTIKISEAYQAMDTEVRQQMAVLFGTTSAESANAYQVTWEKMVSNPAGYASAGLTARFDVAGLAAGDALDTEQRVIDYATAKLAEVDAYGISRMQRIEQFRTERANYEALING